MLINLRNALMSGKRLPYDAEVEYLQSTGTQWINTGILANGEFDVKYTIKTPASFTQQFIVGGARSATQHLNLGQYSTNGNFTLGYLGNYWTALTSVSASDTLYTAKIHYASGSQTAKLNERDTASQTYSGTEALNLSIYIFKRNFYGASDNVPPMVGRLYSFQIWQNGVLVRDMIPVRKGTVGYLYDRVSGKLFGNAGTGDFVLGPDVVPVEYLQSSGTQWIDTGVVPAANDTYTVETRKNNASQDNASFGLAGCVYCFSNGFAPTGYGTFWGHPAVGTGGTAGVNPLGDTNWHTIVASPASVSVDGVVLGNRTDDAQSPLSTVKLFARGNNSASGGVNKKYNGVISHAFIKRGGSDLRKFYAVRVGTEGAMMDTLTRRIYRNAGTGAFGYGNDLKYPIPAE